MEALLGSRARRDASDASWPRADATRSRQVALDVALDVLGLQRVQDVQNFIANVRVAKKSAGICEAQLHCIPRTPRHSKK